MATQFATGITNHEDSFVAGQEAAQQAIAKLKNVQVNLVIVFCSTRYDYAAIRRGIQHIIGENESVKFIGCTTAGQFTDSHVTKDGMVCALIASDTHQFFCGIGTQLKSDPLKSIENATLHFPKDTDEYPHQSAIMLVDGLAGKGEEAVLAAASILGPSVRFAGAAAADNLVFKETVVFSNEEALTDAISICLIASRSPVIISIKHGHLPISGPLRITKAKENILYELEGRPALDIWKDHLREKLKKEGIDIDQLSLAEMSKILLKYEAGLMTGSEYKIRFPASCNPDGSLNFVCSMMEGSVIKIMDSQEQDQIETARAVAELALNQVHKGVKIAGAIIFDCSCRAMILKDQFSEAVHASQKVLGSIPFIGCETYGEIAMDLGQFSGFHNTTTVIMLIPS